MNIFTYLEPVSLEEINFTYDEFSPRMGNKIVTYSQKDNIPDIKKARLALVEATSYVIKSALSLLGIDTVESM